MFSLKIEGFLQKATFSIKLQSNFFYASLHIKIHTPLRLCLNRIKIKVKKLLKICPLRRPELRGHLEGEAESSSNRTGVRPHLTIKLHLRKLRS